VLHALELFARTPRLARFLAEVSQARCAFYGPFDFGAARALPHTPRIRHRRTVLVPARWVLTAADLRRTPGGPVAGRPADEALADWRERWQVPDRVVLCQDELRLPLDLTQPLDRTLLRSRLARAGKAGRVELREDGRPDAHGWLGRPAQFLVPLLRTAPSSRRPPAVTAPADLRGRHDQADVRRTTISEFY